MKKLLFLITALSTLGFASAQTHSNVQIYPNTNSTCYGTNLYVWSAGNSFNPISYQWSNGATSATIAATTSGTYTVTVTGYLGSSNKVITLTKTKTLTVLPKPEIDSLTPLWVCKLDTVKLVADSTYTSVVWNNGTTGNFYEKVFTPLNTGAIPDTVSVWYTASIPGVCSVNSDTVLLRGIRRPRGLNSLSCGRSDLTTSDTVRTEVVLQFIYPVQYEVEFTDVNDTTQTYTYLTALGRRIVLLNMLTPNHTYSVRTRPIINGITYCWGDTCHISIVTNIIGPGDVNRYDDSGVKVYQVFDMSGHLLFTFQGNIFDNNMLRGYSDHMFIVRTISNNGIIQTNKVINITN